jgi:hypothetical protein
MFNEMNLAGVAAAAFPIDRVAGSPLRITGDLNLSHRVRITADTTFPSNGTTNFADSATALHLTGQTLIVGGATFTGPGTLHNGPTGEMTLADGASLDEVGLVNRGLLEIGDSPGVAAVDRFENTASGTWVVEVGGHLLGVEHDHLLVTGGAAGLDGFLQVLLTDDGDGLFLPQVGDEFTILTAVNGVSGAFVNSPVSSIAGQQFHWSIEYNPFDVTLVLTDVTVPEPATLGLVALGAIAIAFERRLRANG